jgi:putative transposase
VTVLLRYNRGNGRRRIFHTPGDYDAFLRVLAEALRRYPGVALLAYCLMPNHWHLVLRPAGDADLPAFMRWLMVTHVRRHHEAHRTRGGGHLYQGRYKSFPIQADEHLLTVLRYMEANAVRAGLAKRARDWRWCSLAQRAEQSRRHSRASSATRSATAAPANAATAAAAAPPLADWPINRPANWEALLDRPWETAELERLRTSVNRGRPLGDHRWIKRTAKRLGLTSSLNPPGRPRGVAPPKPNLRENQ